MANGDTSYPKIPDANWWTIRDLLKKKVPAVISASYISSALSIGEPSANNILGPLRKLGLIDESFKPTELAFDWRDDDKYPVVCQKILETQYPEEIRDLFHTPDADPAKITSWFMSKARCGEATAKLYTRFYLLLIKADPSGSITPAPKKETKTTPQNTKKPVKKIAAQTVEAPAHDAQQKQEPAHSHTQPAVPHTRSLNKSPELHINIQLHISPESSADQIDKIFESMAKHLKNFSG
ncbi:MULTISPECIES: DUF5343 domain-containing protein [unclassified Pseudomonas]|uniref:DUF5343 domain-containing protein n=1 Tax=unclassified Pseudomonas TaxID=196821 RepID=UPI001CC08657|nr:MULTISPECIES: DUF5343 domain-containing protein [unclassified Pseudomonas]